MKKQILFLTFFVAAILAGMNSYAQSTLGAGRTDVDYEEDQYLGGAPECVAAAVMASCGGATSGPLNPIVGQDYTYSVTVNSDLTSNANAGGIRWYVTDDPILFTIVGELNTGSIDPGSGAGDYIMTNSGEYNEPHVATSSSLDKTVTISWQTFDGTIDAAPVLLVAFVVDDAGCTDNIEVYRIEPQFSFALNIGALADGGTINGTPGSTDEATECVSPIEAAVYDGGTDVLTVDYGENWTFFTVNAANFVDSWLPTFLLTYNGAIGEALEADWAYPTEAYDAGGLWNDLTLGTTANVFESAVPVMAGGADVDGAPVNGADNGIAVGVDGECIVVRVRVDHGNTTPAENDADDAPLLTMIHLGVNGFMYDGSAAAATASTEYTNPDYEDLHDDVANTQCITDAYDNDFVEYNLTPRPAVASTTVDAAATNQPFEDKNGSVN